MRRKGPWGPFGLRVSATGLATQAVIGAGALEVFPNPASRQFTLQLPALSGERSAEVTLLNSLGQAVQTRTIQLSPTGTNAQIELGALPAGLYTVRVQAGNQVASRQVVVQ